MKGLILIMLFIVCNREMVNLWKCTMAFKDRHESVNCRHPLNIHLDWQPSIPLVKGNLHLQYFWGEGGGDKLQKTYVIHSNCCKSAVLFLGNSLHETETLYSNIKPAMQIGVFVMRHCRVVLWHIVKSANLKNIAMSIVLTSVSWQFNW